MFMTHFCEALFTGFPQFSCHLNDLFLVCIIFCVKAGIVSNLSQSVINLIHIKTIYLLTAVNGIIYQHAAAHVFL